MNDRNGDVSQAPGHGREREVANDRFGESKLERLGFC
jgi:hypothetical protein